MNEPSRYEEGLEGPPNPSTSFLLRACVSLHRIPPRPRAFGTRPTVLSTQLAQSRARGREHLVELVQREDELRATTARVAWDTQRRTAWTVLFWERSLARLLGANRIVL